MLRREVEELQERKGEGFWEDLRSLKVLQMVFVDYGFTPRGSVMASYLNFRIRASFLHKDHGYLDPRTVVIDRVYYHNGYSQLRP